MTQTTCRILDGTHRWVKAWQEGTPTLPVLAIDLSVDEALELMRRFTHVKFAANQLLSQVSNAADDALYRLMQVGGSKEIIISGDEFVCGGIAPKLLGPITNVNPNHDDKGRFASSEGVDTSDMGFAELLGHVRGRMNHAFEGDTKRDGDLAVMHLPGNRRLKVEVKEDKDGKPMVRLDFETAGNSLTHSEEHLQAGTVTFFKQLGHFAKLMHADGVKMEVVPSDERRSKVYAKLLERAGLKLEREEGSVYAAAKKQVWNNLSIGDVPDVQQRKTWDCGPSAMKSVADSLGVVKPLSEWTRLLDTDEDGTSPQGMMQADGIGGLRLEEHHNMEVWDLWEATKDGELILCPIQADGDDGDEAGHWVVVLEVRDGYVVVQDPSVSNILEDADHDVAASGKVMIEEEAFDEAWRDVDADGNVFDHYGIVVSRSAVENANPNHDEKGRFANRWSPPNNDSEAADRFHQVVDINGGNKTGKQYGQQSRTIGMPGGRFISISLSKHKDEDNVSSGYKVRLDFGIAEQGSTYSAKGLQSGTVDMMRKLEHLAHSFHHAGFKLAVGAADERRKKFYQRAFEKAGFKLEGQDGGEQIWNLSYTSFQEPLRNAVPNALDAFQQWLKRQLGQLIVGKTQEQMWDAYIQAGAKKGMARAFSDVKKYQPGQSLDFYKGTKEEFLRSAFGQPVAREKVQLLASRSYDELENVTVDMSNKLSRVLTDGLIEGKHPNVVAKDMTDEVDISFGRAKVIARTELIRTHAEGQLLAFEQLGVDKLGVEVEFTGTQDDKMCDECADLEGQEFSIDEAHGVIPVHPNCRCCFRPAGDVLTGNLLVDDLREPAAKHWDDLLLNAYEGDGHWVTLEEGQHVFIGGDGSFNPRGPGAEHGRGSRQRDGSKHAADGKGLASKAGRSGDSTGSGSGSHDDQPVGGRLAQDVPDSKEAVNAKLDRYEKFFRSKGMHDQAEWMAKLRSHVNEVGTDAALKELGEEIKGKGEQVHYAGQDLEGKGDRAFVEGYLAKHGISTVHETQFDPSKKVISTTAPSSDTEGVHARGKESDVFPKLQGLKDKLDEAQHLPGLEKSEDLAKLMGGERGAGVSHLLQQYIM